jgi:hypothetical protein
MNLDLSVAPEMARLAGVWDAAPVHPPVTVGYLAGCLRALMADPQAWWGLVRFDPGQAVRVPVPVSPARCEAWLLVAPPGDRGEGAAYSHGQVACVIAGELEHRPGGRPLLPGRVLVRGGHRAGRLVNVGAGYAISLHARPCQADPARLTTGTS